MEVIENNKTLHAATVGHQVHQVIGAGLGLGIVVTRNAAAHGDSGIERNVVEGRLHRATANIVKKDVPFFRTGGTNLRI